MKTSRLPPTKNLPIVCDSGFQKVTSILIGAFYLFIGTYLNAQEAPVVPGDVPATTTETAADTNTAVATTPTATATATTAADTKAKKPVLVFENADLRLVLQALAKQAGISLIIPDDVKGTVTARLVDIPVERAMRTILESKGYSLVELDGVYQVKSKESIASEPTKTELYQFANANAAEAKPTVDKLLTKAGTAQIDPRSNTLVITDVPSNLAKIIPILKTLDVPTPQVLIETKLMEMTRNPQEAIGINWSSLASYQVSISNPADAAGTPLGRVRLGVTRSGDPGAIGTTSAGRRGGVITPATAAGVPFAAVLDAPAFNLTFSFLLQDNDTELLGSPKVVTTDNKEAIIKIATQEPIPNFTFNQQTASFVISGFEFKDIGNILQVTPHVNKDNFITLDVVPTVSTALTGASGRGFSLGTGGTVTIPLISTRTLTSRVMVKSGNTLALGGLLESASTRAFTKVPFLGDIPGLGELFRSRSFNKTKRNLLVFITPTVIGTDGSTGLEDQYSSLKEFDENDRFAYKKSFMGNAKPRDQFKTMDPTESALPRQGRPADETVVQIPVTTAREVEKVIIEKAPGENTVTIELDPDQLAPRLAPELRE